MFLLVVLAIVLIVLFAVAALLMIVARLLRRLLHRPSAPAPIVAQPGPAPGTAPGIPDIFTPASLSAVLRTRLAGMPADGSVPASATPAAAIWVDRGDEVLVHFDSLSARFVDRLMLVSLDLESDQTGRSTIVVPFALGAENDPAGLFAVTYDTPQGDPLLVARWGSTVRDAAWASMLQLARDHAGERAAAPRGFTVAGGTLQLRAGPPLFVKPA